MTENNKWTACSCNTCVDMCKQRPCWGTPEEIAGLIELGFGSGFMLDWWVDVYNGDIYVVSPAIAEYESQRAPGWPTGRCTFLNENNLCDLHDTGFKPMGARLALCRGSQEGGRAKKIAHMCDSAAGKEIVEEWWEGRTK